MSGTVVYGRWYSVAVSRPYCLWNTTQQCQPAWHLVTFSKNDVYLSSQILHISSTGLSHMANLPSQWIWILRSPLLWRMEPWMSIRLMKMRQGEASPWRNQLKSSLKARHEWNILPLLYQHIKHFWGKDLYSSIFKKIFFWSSKLGNYEKLKKKWGAQTFFISV